MANIMRLGGGTTLKNLGFVNVPSGNWKLKTGTLEVSELNQETIIPLAISWQWSFSKAGGNLYQSGYVKYNNGKEMAICTLGVDNYGYEGAWPSWTGNIDLINKFSKDLTLLKSITGFRNYTKIQIVTWFEKQ